MVVVQVVWCVFQDERVMWQVRAVLESLGQGLQHGLGYGGVEQGFEDRRRAWKSGVTSETVRYSTRMWDTPSECRGQGGVCDKAREFRRGRESRKGARKL